MKCFLQQPGAVVGPLRLALIKKFKRLQNKKLVQNIVHGLLRVLVGVEVQPVYLQTFQSNFRHYLGHTVCNRLILRSKCSSGTREKQKSRFCSDNENPFQISRLCSKTCAVELLQLLEMLARARARLQQKRHVLALFTRTVCLSYRFFVWALIAVLREWCRRPKDFRRLILRILYRNVTARLETAYFCLLKLRKTSSYRLSSNLRL